MLLQEVMKLKLKSKFTTTTTTFSLPVLAIFCQWMDFNMCGVNLGKFLIVIFATHTEETMLQAKLLPSHLP